MNFSGGVTQHTIGVRITAENRELDTRLTQSKRAIEDLGKASEEAGSKSESSWNKARVSADGLLSKMGQFAGVLTALLPVAISLGQALSSGWNRLTTLADSTRALTIQLRSAGLAAEAMRGTLDVVTGTPYDLDQFANVTQNLVSFGVEVEKIPNHLTAMGEAAATKGRDAPEMVERIARAYGQMSTLGTAAMDPIRSIESAGVPALRILANQMGQTTAQTQEMVSAGLIPASEAMDMLSEGILEGTRGAAGATIAFAGTMEGLREELSGAAGGLSSAMARLGANIWGPFEDVLIKGFANVASWMDQAGKQINSFFTTAVSAFQNVGHRVSSVLNPLVRTSENLVRIVINLSQSLGMAAQSFLGVAAAISLPVFTFAAEVLAAISGVLADYPWIITAIASLLATRYIPALTNAVALGTTWVGVMGLNIAQLWTKGRAALTAAGGLRGLAASLMTVRTATIAATGAAAILLTVFLSLRQRQDEAVESTRALGREIGNQFNPYDLKSGEIALAGLRDEIERLGELRGNDRPWWLGGQWASFGDVQQQREYIALQEEMQDVAGRVGNVMTNMNQIVRETGYSWDDVNYIMQENRIDLSMSSVGDAAEQARGHVVAGLQDMEAAAGESLSSMNDWLGISADGFEAFQQKMDSAIQSAVEGFASTRDVIGGWEPDAGIQEEIDALDRLAEARDELKSARADDNQRLVESALKRIAEAESDLIAAQQMQAEGTLEAHYERAIALMSSFSDDLNTAMGMGLDPQAVTRLLEMGPTEAAAILEELVSDSSGAMIELVNASEKALNEASARIVEQARLTARAVNAETDELAKALPEASQISALAWEGVYIQDIADAMGLSEARVREVGEMFNITFSAGFTGTAVSQHDEYIERMNLDGDSGYQAGVNYGTGFVNGMEVALSSAPRIGPPVPAAPSRTTPYYPPGTSFSYASGTSSVLPGWTPGRDVHHFYSPTAGHLSLSGGEGIGRPEFVAALGPARWDALNQAARSGGVAAVQRLLGPNLGSFANGTSSLRVHPVPVPVSSSHTTEAPMYVQNMHVNDPGEGYRVARQSRALDQVGGRRGF